jgi:hypothetical protein
MYKLKPHQKEAKKLLLKGKVKLLVLPAGCVDRDTEFLTPEGWKKIGDYQEGDLVAEWKAQEDGLGLISFVKPKSYTVADAEYLNRVKTVDVDMVLSDEHKVPYTLSKQKPSSYEIDTFNTLKTRDILRIPRHFTLEERREGLNLTNTLIKVLIMQRVCSYRRENSHFNTIEIKDIGFKKRVIKILQGADVFYCLSKDGTKILFKPKPQRNLCVLWGANLKQLRFIKEEVLTWGDFSNLDKEELDFLQYCFSVVSNKCTSLEEATMVREEGNSLSEIDMRKISKYKTLDGKMYCFTVDTGFWLARRNGKIFPTGNSGKTYTSFSYIKDLQKKKKIKTLMISENNLLDQISEDHEKFYGNSDNISTIKQIAIKKRIEKYDEFLDDDSLDTLAFNYHTLVKDYDEIDDLVRGLKKKGYTICVCADEVEIARNETSDFYKTLLNLNVDVKYRVGLTASPVKKGLEELYNILTTLRGKPIMKPEKFYDRHCDIELTYVVSLNAKKKRLGKPITVRSKNKGEPIKIGIPMYVLKRCNDGGGTKPLVNCAVEVDRKNYIVTCTVDSNNLGHFKFLYRGVEVSGWVSVQQKVIGYKDVSGFYNVAKKYLYSISKKSIGTPPFKLHHKILKLKEGSLEWKALKCVYEDSESTKTNTPYASETIACVAPDVTLFEYDKKAKVRESLVIKALLSDLKEYLKKGEQVIVFSKYTKVLEYFELVLNLKYPDYTYGTISGGISKTLLSRTKKEFINGSLDILMISESGLRGLNLQNCGVILCLDSPITGGDTNQLAGRVARLGSKYKKLHYHLYTIEDTILEDIYKLVFGQLALLKELTPHLLEEGIFDDSVEKLSILGEESKYLRQGLTSRKEKFLQKKT